MSSQGSINTARVFAAHTHEVLESGFQIRVGIGNLFSLSRIQNICCGYSKEPSQGNGSFQPPKHMFKLMGKKIVKIFTQIKFPYLDLWE